MAADRTRAVTQGSGAGKTSTMTSPASIAERSLTLLERNLTLAHSLQSRIADGLRPRKAKAIDGSDVEVVELTAKEAASALTAITASSQTLMRVHAIFDAKGGGEPEKLKSADSASAAANKLLALLEAEGDDPDA